VAGKRGFYLGATQKIFSDVDLFLAPSRFLRDRYISCGIPGQKIVFARYGLKHFTRLPHRHTNGRPAFGYIGALHRHKGVEVLLEAFKGLGDRADLHIFGSAFGSPISESYWRRISEERPAGVTFHGAYDNTRIGEILAGLDAVIVPSIWYENSPLTIQEAFIAGVPVVTSDRGGMAELVRDGIDGLHFRLGDAGDLHQKLEQLISAPARLEELAKNVPVVPRIEEQAAELRERYRTLLTTGAEHAP
jgi:glycosyltransferase involved in cell wall biosynthesis